MTNHADPVEGFVVATDDPGHPGITLFMVDRRKERKSFWSFNLKSVFILNTREVANVHVDILKFNNPRVMSWVEAQIALAKNKELNSEV